MQAQDFDKVKYVAENSVHTIDTDHKVAKGLSIERIGPLKQLFHFENR